MALLYTLCLIYYLICNLFGWLWVSDKLRWIDTVWDWEDAQDQSQCFPSLTQHTSSNMISKGGDVPCDYGPFFFVKLKQLQFAFWPLFIQSLRMQCFFHVSKNSGFLPITGCSPPYGWDACFAAILRHHHRLTYHHQHHHPYNQSDLDDSHPDHHRMLKVVVMFALRRSRPAHHTDRWHRTPKTIQNKQSLCDTAKKSSFARCWNTCWLSLTFEEKKLSLDSVCTALFNQVEVSQRSRLQIFKH